MCHASIAHAVQERLLASGGAVQASASNLAASTDAFTQRPSPPRAVVDLTHELTPDFPTYEGGPAFEAAPDRPREDALGFEVQRLAYREHVGTHLDAPLHADAAGRSVAEIPVGRLVCPLLVMDIAARAEHDPDEALTPDDIADWMKAHGDIPPGSCVAMHSGWERKLGGPGFRNEDDDGVLHFPGVHPEATAMLIEMNGVVGLASDTLSLDIGASTTFETHFRWLPSGRRGLECVANLGALPPVGATLIVGAPKRRGGTGGPSRVLALL